MSQNARHELSDIYFMNMEIIKYNVSCNLLIKMQYAKCYTYNWAFLLDEIKTRLTFTQKYKELC